jgi:hypothetical protein
MRKDLPPVSSLAGIRQIPFVRKSTIPDGSNLRSFFIFHPLADKE